MTAVTSTNCQIIVAVVSTAATCVTITACISVVIHIVTYQCIYNKFKAKAKPPDQSNIDKKKDTVDSFCKNFAEIGAIYEYINEPAEGDYENWC